MAAVYSAPNYGGAAYKLFAPVGQCNTLPAGVNNGVQSMQINTVVTPACWIYTNANCAGDNYAIVGKNNVAQMQGVYNNSVQSVICDKPAS
ncbi:hypothetical protein CJF30_00002958 [Rutstroemia sp. NJR-2017a BBW]|nr:hypothetical protein CJF30_00002958 [Rutstroemia sp. NJR-2017a BBW]